MDWWASCVQNAQNVICHCPRVIQQRHWGSKCSSLDYVPRFIWVHSMPSNCAWSGHAGNWHACESLPPTQDSAAGEHLHSRFETTECVRTAWQYAMNADSKGQSLSFYLSIYLSISISIITDSIGSSICAVLLLSKTKNITSISHNFSHILSLFLSLFHPRVISCLV